MSEILNKTRALLHMQSLTVVISDGEKTYTSEKRGVAPLLELLESGTDVRGFSGSDKVVGRAAAYLYVLLGVKEIYADVMSELAASVLSRYGIEYSFGELACGIINREGTGPCPMENATKDIDDPYEALVAIKVTLRKLKEKER